VDPDNGNDEYDGQTRRWAKQSIQDALDSIPVVQTGGSPAVPVNARHGGRIHCMDGRHDVGSGLVMRRGLPIELDGVYNPVLRTSTSGGEMIMKGPTLYSSDTIKPQSLIRLGLAADDEINQNAYGHKFRNLIWEMAGVTKYCVDAERWNMGLVEGCSWRHLDLATEPDSFCVRNQGENIGGSDCSWIHMVDNEFNSSGLYRNTAPTTQGLNANHHCFNRNIGFSGGTRTEAMISLENAQGCWIEGNNLEVVRGTGGNKTMAIEFRPSPGGNGNKQNYIGGNTGEFADFFLVADEFWANLVFETGCRVTTRDQADPDDNSKLIWFKTNALANFVIDGVTTPYGGSYDQSPIARVVDGIQNTILDTGILPA